MINLLKKLLKKRENDWYVHSENEHYDLRSIPDFSKESPIKDYKITYYYRYCPIYKKLQKQNISGTWNDLNMNNFMTAMARNGGLNKSTDRLDRLLNFIEEIDKAYERDQKINKIIKK
jgi:hypothetical protein